MQFTLAAFNNRLITITLPNFHVDRHANPPEHLSCFHPLITGDWKLTD